MRTANNSNFTVEALVAKYRNFVKEHSPKSYSVCESSDGKLVDVFTPISPDSNADEQLIATLYASVAGINANQQVLSVLAKYYEKYRKDVFNENEFEFLCDNFKEVISYEFSHRNWLGSIIAGCQVPSQNLEIIRGMAEPKEGQTVFIADAGCCDVAVLFPECTVQGFTGFCGATMYYDEVWALGQIRLYAAGIQSEIIPGSFDEEKNKYTYTLPEKGSVDVVICGTMWDSECDDIQQLYDLLKPNGTMFWFSDRKGMAGNGKEEVLRKQIVNEKAIHTLVSFEGDFVGIASEVILAYIRKKTNEIVQIINVKKGISSEVKSENLDYEILWPSFYLAKRPQEGKPLSSIVELSANERLAKFEKGKGHILIEESKDMLLVLPNDLGESYKEADLMGKPVCFATDPAFEKKQFWFHVAKQPCILLCGSNNKLRIGFTPKMPSKGFAYLADCCLVPKKGIDIRYATALLFLPTVAEQIMMICDGNIRERTLSLVLDKIIVPEHDEKERLAFLVEANYKAFISTRNEMEQGKKQYVTSVRMRKHTLTQSLSSVEAMFYALNSYREKHGVLNNKDVISRVKKTTVHEAFEFISQGLKDMMPALEHIAEVEYTFEKPEWIDPEKFIEEYIQKNEKGWLNFKPVVTWEHGHNQAADDLKNPVSGDTVIRKGDSFDLFLFPKDALERVFKNIISNAKAHGFGDKSRNDYQVRFSWHTDGMSLTIEIENNGSPIPSDRDTASLLEYGVSTKLHHDGHNGIGCNEIDDIMKRYDGKIEIVSLPGNEFPVKYILTFNRSNNVRAFKI